jgi:hypothetical protein
MLPDFPKLKERLLIEHSAKFKRQTDSQMPIMSKIKSVPSHEGHCFSIERTDGVVERQDFIEMQVPIVISRQLSFPDTIDQIAQRTRELSSNVAKQMELLFQTRFEETMKEVGNAVDMQGAPLTFETFLDMLDRVDMDFDNFGMPEWPEIHPPAMREVLRQQSVRLSTESQLRERAESILKKKREDWRDRESRRRLVS